MKSLNYYQPGDIEYILDPNLEAAVQIAIKMGMPLLVTGEPGTGKTLLAKHVADHMLYEEEDTEEKPKGKLHRFNTKTTSEAKDILYRYDALRHFRDSQNQVSKNPMAYISFNALGQAIIDSHTEVRQVVLIDEIDKAPRDFPNDVLFEFEQLAFSISEANPEEINKWEEEKKVSIPRDENDFVISAEEAENKPFLILTSNSEKNLPDAFLRRCAYFHITFPKRPKLLQIITANTPLSERFGQKMLEDAVDHFIQIREELDLKKPPATAELLAWMHILEQEGIDVKKELGKTEKETRTLLHQSYVVLLKTQQDREHTQKAF